MKEQRQAASALSSQLLVDVNKVAEENRADDTPLLRAVAFWPNVASPPTSNEYVRE